MDYSTPGSSSSTIFQFAQIHVHWVGEISNHLILCHLLLFLLSVFPSSASFPMNQFFTSHSRSIRASASATVLPMNNQGWFPLGLTGLILLSKGLSIVFSSITVWKRQFFGCQPSSMVWFSHPCMTTRKTIALTIWNFVSKVMSLLFNMLSIFVIASLPRS